MTSTTLTTPAPTELKALAETAAARAREFEVACDAYDEAITALQASAEAFTEAHGGSVHAAFYAVAGACQPDDGTVAGASIAVGGSYGVTTLSSDVQELVDLLELGISKSRGAVDA